MENAISLTWKKYDVKELLYLLNEIYFDKSLEELKMNLINKNGKTQEHFIKYS